MRKKINLEVRKIIAKNHKKQIKNQFNLQPKRTPNFEDLFEMARKNLKYFNTKSQGCSVILESQSAYQSLPGSRNTPQNSGREQLARKTVQRLNRSVEAKRANEQFERSLSHERRRGTLWSSKQKIKANKEEQNKNIYKQHANTIHSICQSTTSEQMPIAYPNNSKLNICVEPSVLLSFREQFNAELLRLNHSDHEHVRGVQCFLSVGETFQLLRRMNYLKRIEDEKFLLIIWECLRGEEYGGILCENLYQLLTWVNECEGEYCSGQAGKMGIDKGLRVIANEEQKRQIYQQFLPLRVNRILSKEIQDHMKTIKKKFSPKHQNKQGSKQNQPEKERTSNIKIVDEEEEKKIIVPRKLSFLKKGKSEDKQKIAQKVELKVKQKQSKQNKEGVLRRTLRLRPNNQSKQTTLENAISCTSEESEIAPTKPFSEDTISTEGIEIEECIVRCPILSVEVNLGEGIIEKLMVYEGQSAYEVSKRLMQKYGIDDGVRIKFQQMLQGHLRKLLWKIQEVAEEMFSDRDGE